MAIVRFSYNNLADTASAITALSEAADYPVENVQHDWLQRSWRSTGVADEWVKFDMGAAVNVTSFFIRNHNLRIGAGTLRIQASSDDVWAAPEMVVNQLITVTPDIIEYTWSAAQSYRWWRILIDDAGNTDGYFRLGRVFLGTSVSPSRNYNWAYPITRLDPSELIESDGGQVSVNTKTQYRQWVLDFRGLTDADHTALMTMYETVGRAVPYFISLDPDDGYADLHYVRNMTDWQFVHENDALYSLQINVREER